MNCGQALWQTDLYRDTYQADPALACEHLHLPSPLFILLDAQDRTREEIEQKEGANWQLATSGDLP